MIRNLAMIVLVSMVGLAIADDVPVARAKRVIFYHAHYCGPCRTAMPEIEEWMRPQGWTFGDETCHVQYVDIEKTERPHVTLTGAIERLPTFVLVQDSREVTRVVGYDMTQEIRLRRRVIADLWTSKGAKQCPTELVSQSSSLRDRIEAEQER